MGILGAWQGPHSLDSPERVSPSHAFTVPASAELLVVDDDSRCLDMLDVMLSDAGYRVRTCLSGPLAFAAIADKAPALILLDIDMGAMNGFEVCARLKADPAAAAIPVVFISGADDTEAKLRAFKAGGVDYITKPFRIEEVLARVQTHLKIHFLQEALAGHNRQLEETVRQRTRELDSALQRLSILDKAKSDFLTLISHELRTPLTGLLGFTDLVLAEGAGSGLASAFKQPYEESRRRLMNILEDAMLLSRIEVEKDTFVFFATSLQAVFNLAVQPIADFAAVRRVRIEAHDSVSGWVHGSEELLVKALGALLETAVKFADPGTRVSVRCTADGGHTRLAIEARGRIIPPDFLPKFFDVLSIAETLTPGGDLGLDPPVAERVIVLCGGSVHIENLEPAGIRILVRMLPATPPGEAAATCSPGN